jgi:hypothetical protein
MFIWILNWNDYLQGSISGRGFYRLGAAPMHILLVPAAFHSEWNGRSLKLASRRYAEGDNVTISLDFALLHVFMACCLIKPKNSFQISFHFYCDFFWGAVLHTRNCLFFWVFERFSVAWVCRMRCQDSKKFPRRTFVRTPENRDSHGEPLTWRSVGS